MGGTSRKRQWPKIWTLPQNEWSKGRKTSKKIAGISRIQAKEKCPCGTEARVKNAGQKSPQPCRNECYVCWVDGGQGRERGEHKPCSYDTHTFCYILQINDSFATILGVIVM